MMKLSHLLTAVAFAFTVGSELAANELWGGSFSKLKSRVIRSIAIAPHDQSLIVVGNKGPAAGDAKLFASSNAGVSWQFLNGGKPLSANATDVQAVAVVSPSILLAGTWKHGLYRSQNAGQSFDRVTDIPAKDIRSILVLQSGRVLAATGAGGIWKSDDSGASWSASGLASGYFWSLSSNADSLLLAASPSLGLFQSTDSGDTWQRISSEEGIYEAAAHSGLIAAVGENGLIIRPAANRQWNRVERFAGIRLSSISIAANRLYIGSWKDGLWEYSVADGSVSQYSQGLPVLHVKNTGSALMAGSWGKGLHVLPVSERTEFLVTAAKARDAEVVGQLLNAGAAPDAFDRNRNTALIFAARDGLTNVVRQLIQSGAEVNWIDGEGVTPLILASFKNHPDIVRLLLDQSADKTVVDGFGRTALDYALRRGESDAIAKMLR